MTTKMNLSTRLTRWMSDRVSALSCRTRVRTWLHWLTTHPSVGHVMWWERLNTAKSNLYALLTLNMGYKNSSPRAGFLVEDHRDCKHVSITTLCRISASVIIYLLSLDPCGITLITPHFKLRDLRKKKTCSLFIPD